MSETKTLKEEFSSLKEVVNKHNDSVNRLLFIMNNDAETGRKGLVAEVRDHNADISELKKKLPTTFSNKKLTMPSKREKISLGAWLVGLFGQLF